MNAIFSGPQLAYLLIALVVLGLAFAGIVWVGRMIRGELGPGASRGGNSAGLAMLGQISPAMMKEAIAKGLVVPSQLAGMTEAERMFLFASLKQKLAPAAPVVPAAEPDVVPVVAPVAPVVAPLAPVVAPLAPVVAPVAPVAPVAAPVTAPAVVPVVPPSPAQKPTPPALPADIPPAMLAILNAEKFRVWCPMCGTELKLPTFPPLLARCASCGMKSAIRGEEGGRYIVIVSPPPNL